MARPLDHDEHRQRQLLQCSGSSVIPILEYSITVGRDIPPALMGKVHWIEWTLFCDELDEALAPLRHYRVLHSTTNQPRRQRRNSHASYFFAGISIPKRSSSSIIKVKTKVLKQLQRVCDKQSKKWHNVIKEFVLYCPFDNNHKNSNHDVNIENWHIQIVLQDLLGMAPEEHVFWNNADIPSTISVPSSSSSFSVPECTTAHTTNTTNTYSTASTPTTHTTTTSDNFFPFQELPRPQRPPPLQFPSSPAVAIVSPPTRKKRRLFGSGRKSWFSLPIQVQPRNYHRSSSLSSLPSRTSSLSSVANHLFHNSSSTTNHNNNNRANPYDTPLPNNHHHHHHHQQQQQQQLTTSSLTNPFVDDPHDSVAMSRDALWELDRVLERQWMSAPSLFVCRSRHNEDEEEEEEDDDDDFIVPIPPPTTMARATTTTR